MRTKVVSIIAVIAVFMVAWFWSIVNLPPFEEHSGLQTGAFTIFSLFNVIGFWIGMLFTIKWLMGGK